MQKKDASEFGKIGRGFVGAGGHSNLLGSYKQAQVF